MKIIQYLLRLPQRIINHIKRKQFFKKYKKISRSSFIGKNGTGKGCKLEGYETLTIGSNTFIGEGSELLAYESHFERPLDAHLTIGKNVRITARCRITCAGNISIGDNALFAADVFITDHNHGMNPEVEGGYSPQDISIDDVTIGKGVWLGQRVCVLPGVTIGDHSIVGANSVVTKSIPPYAVAVGAPARVIKKWNFDRKCWENVQENH